VITATCFLLIYVSRRTAKHLGKMQEVICLMERRLKLSSLLMRWGLIMAVSKKTNVKDNQASKSSVKQNYSSDGKKLVWAFDNVDKNGPFYFDVEREDFDSKSILSWMIVMSNRTWSEIRRDTHDKSDKTCHHFLDYDGLSKEAKARVDLMISEEEREEIFSFRMTNLCRIIGLRKDEVFHAKWFDKDHKFYPSSK